MHSNIKLLVPLAVAAILLVYGVLTGAAAVMADSAYAYYVAGSLVAGVFAIGSFVIGVLAAGLFSFGFAAAGLFAFGGYAAGLFAAGYFAIGVFSIGIYPIGVFAVGPHARGLFVQGEHARGLIVFGPDKDWETSFNFRHHEAKADKTRLRALADGSGTQTLPAAASEGTG